MRPLRHPILSRHPLVWILLATLLPLEPIMSAANWQLALYYSEDGTLELASADPIAPCKKIPKAPNRDGGLFEVPVAIDWLDPSGTVVSSAQTIMPLGVRIPISEDNPSPGIILPENLVVLRVAGPDPGIASQVRVSQMESFAKHSDPSDQPKLNSDFTFPLDAKTVTRFNPPPTVFPTTKIRDSGADGSNLVIVVMGDGYVQAELDSGKYAADVTRTLAAFTNVSPWDQMLKATNIYRVDVPSNQSGSDRENGANGTLKDTYFDTGYYTSGIPSLLTPSTAGIARSVEVADATAGAGMWNQVIIIVNSTVYGGAGGPLTTTSVNGNGPLVAIHEVGHSFPGLADEYGGAITVYDGQPVSEPNVDTNPNAPKWANWIESPPPPLPTPDNATYSSTVGAFEGARYNNLGIYRPTTNCRMRTLNVPFCPVCKEQHMRSFFEIVPFTESVSPADLTTASVSSAQTFTVKTVPLDDITYEWFLDGKKIEGETSSTLSRSTAELPAPSQQLTMNASYTSPLMRSDQPSDSFSWTVNNTGVTPAGTPHWWLTSNNLGVGPNDDQTDHDNDGQRTAAEYLAGTDPMDKNSVLKFSTVDIASTGGVLEFETISGHHYRLECASKLDDWTPVSGYEDIDGNDEIVQYLVSNTTESSRFYRIAVWIP